MGPMFVWNLNYASLKGYVYPDQPSAPEAGFSLLDSFTWSKAISNAPQYRNAGGITGSENSPPQNSFNLSA